MDRWERKLATRDTNRVVRPFEWGTDWLQQPRISRLSRPTPTATPRSAWLASSTEALADSDRFYSYQPVHDYRLDGRAG